MTFTEAALEVLRSAGEPLHYKKITEIAIARNLLSHVGKSPEVTMSSRLATMVKKDRGQSPIVKVRPGVFAIRESAMSTDNDAAEEQDHEIEESAEDTALTTPAPALDRPPLPGADVFPAEEDDDAPILAGLEERPEDPGRRRRRRRRRGGKPVGGDSGSAEANADTRDSGRRDRGPDRSHDRNHERNPDRNQERDRDRASFERDRSFDRGFDRDRDRARVQGRDQRGRDHVPPIDLNREPGEGDLLGKDLADAAYAVLARSDRLPASFARIADWLVQRGRLMGSPEVLAPTVAAALRADAARSRRGHTRERFRIHDQRVSLLEWLVPRDAIRTEENVERSAEQQRDQVRRAFASRLNELPAAGFAELIATWLNGEGVTSLRAVRRPGSSGREFHFAGTLRRGTEENRLAFVVLRAGRDIERDLVIDARGSLQHYGNATGAWLVTTARIAGSAREEASLEGASPCALFSGLDLARSMEQLGFGIKQHFVALCDIDFELLESLGDTSGRRDRDDRARFDHDRGRAQRDYDARERLPREQESREPERAPASEGASEPEAKREFDLLDPAIAEESRLVSPDEDWEAPEDAAEGADEVAEGEESSVRLSPARAADGADEEGDCGEGGDELELEAAEQAAAEDEEPEDEAARDREGSSGR